MKNHPSVTIAYARIFRDLMFLTASPFIPPEAHLNTKIFFTIAG
jgi:hypothetical protein